MAFNDVLIYFTTFLSEHPDSQSHGENTCSGHFYDKQEEREETLEEKPWKEL